MILKNIFKNRIQSLVKNKGVSLIELLVVIAIFTIISGITIFSYNDFRSSLSIQNLADDIALSVRKAQNYAMGSVGAVGSFNYAYGINFSVKPTNKSFVLFIDQDNSGYFNDEYVNNCDEDEETNCSERFEVLSITSNDVISDITLNMNNSDLLLQNDDQIDLLFKRPNPEPFFCYRPNGNSSCDEGSIKISNIKIKIASERDNTIYKIITISNNGQISVDF